MTRASIKIRLELNHAPSFWQTVRSVIEYTTAEKLRCWGQNIPQPNLASKIQLQKLPSASNKIIKLDLGMMLSLGIFSLDWKLSQLSCVWLEHFCSCFCTRC